MSLLYAVRCNFARQDLETAWNDWYNGPKLKQMLAKPLFLSGQRFAAVDLDVGRKYLALWTVESDQAFSTPEYRSDWGFFEWAPHITDWNRDLYGIEKGEIRNMIAVPPQAALYLVSFDDLSVEEAETKRARFAPFRPQVHWFNAVGLDKRSPILGLYVAPSREWRPAPAEHVEGVRETMYHPICPYTEASQ